MVLIFIRDPSLIQHHILEYVKDIFHKGVLLGEHLIMQNGMIGIKLHNLKMMHSFYLLLKKKLKKQFLIWVQINLLILIVCRCSFYQYYWDTIKRDLLAIFSDFYDGHFDISHRAIICLIPKISDFKKISTN
jgi:hypothetical protein